MYLPSSKEGRSSKEQTKSFWKNLWIASNATEVNASAHFIRVIVFHLFLSHSNSTYIYQPTFKSRNFAQEQRNCWNSTCASTFSNFISYFPVFIISFVRKWLKWNVTSVKRAFRRLIVTLEAKVFSTVSVLFFSLCLEWLKLAKRKSFKWQVWMAIFSAHNISVTTFTRAIVDSVCSCSQMLGRIFVRSSDKQSSEYSYFHPQNCGRSHLMRKKYSISCKLYFFICVDRQGMVG